MYIFLGTDDIIYPSQEHDNKKKRLDRVKLHNEMCNRR